MAACALRGCMHSAYGSLSRSGGHSICPTTTNRKSDSHQPAAQPQSQMHFRCRFSLLGLHRWANQSRSRQSVPTAVRVKTHLWIGKQ
ncbi:AAEL008209-PA [Aedes aegypti]|uniref:AAEL008209-PA n=1 Tax=Aedes aegypti TaxID=7159 RepID=Q16ZG4_AEDAE|nr:AAEL008209-PA [Aedes aegypti]